MNISLANGCEKVTSNDLANCRTCGRASSNANGTPSCVAGACQASGAEGARDGAA